MENLSWIIKFATTILPFLHLFGFGMNVAWITTLLTVVFLLEFLLVANVDGIFFPSLLSSSKVKTNFPTTGKLGNEDAKVEDGNRQDSKEKPHIVIILADDMGWNDVSFHGSDQIPTPNIDALAYNGIILNNHYVPALCTPSRTALMTGKNPIHLGMQHSVLLPAEPRGLPLSEKLLPEYLKEIGYRTHAVGKWHLGYFRKEYTPTYRGFDSHYGYWNGLQDYYTHITQEQDISDFRGFDMRRNLTVAWETQGKYSTDLFTNEAVRLIKEHDTNQPMFLYLAHLAPHKGNPNQLLRASDKDIAKFSYILDPERRIQAAVISKLDQSVGEVIDALRNRGMLKNSIVLFMSDNGAPTEGVLSNQGSNYPLRGIKDSPWEGGTRGVAAIWSPLIKEPRRVSNQMMFMADWFPTLLSAAGAERKHLGNIDGFDLWPALISDKISPRSDIVLNIDDISNYSAIRRGDFKYVIGQTETGRAWLGATGNSSEGVSPKYDPFKVLYSKVGVAISGVITVKQAMELDERRKNVKNGTNIPLKTDFQAKILTADKLLELRNNARIRCNVKEENKIPCNPTEAPCLFNIEKDPCEMVNLAERRPLILAILERVLTNYRLTMVPPSNVPDDPKANPLLWNNTWTSWDDPNPLALAFKINEYHTRSGPAIAVMSIICGLFIVGVITLFALKCDKSNSNDTEDHDYENGQETAVRTANYDSDSLTMSKIIEDAKRDSEDRN
ncbi:arylsulfatase B isoform X1 [Osmia lignaria lignaria]|uniref:arylsulfatase B isoform X1 n=2 Tax=Osmia lignaria lignaria TaxID=1437193 RepID=UPI00402B341F